VRQGDVVTHIRSWRGFDLMSLCGAIVNEIDAFRPVEVNVDSIGLGAGLADRLRELGHPVRDVNVSETSAFNPKALRRLVREGRLPELRLGPRLPRYRGRDLDALVVAA
jgi:hypothetical protein